MECPVQSLLSKTAISDRFLPLCSRIFTIIFLLQYYVVAGCKLATKKPSSPELGKKANQYTSIYKILVLKLEILCHSSSFQKPQSMLEIRLCCRNITLYL